MKNILFLLLIIPVMLQAQIPDPEKGTYVHDFAGVVHSTEKQIINAQLRALEDSFGVQMAIVLIDQLPGNYSIDDYSLEIGRKWHVGIAKTGIVYVAAIQDHKQRIDVANHLEGIITDLMATRILDGIKPYFRAGKYGTGLIQGITVLRDDLTGAKSELQKLTGAGKKTENKPAIWAWLLFLFPSFFATFYLIRKYILKKRKLRREAEHEARLRDESLIDAQLKQNLSQMINRDNRDAKVKSIHDKPVSRTNVYSDDPVILSPPKEIIHDDYVPPSRETDYTPSKSNGYSSGDTSNSSVGYTSTDYGNYGNDNNNNIGSSDSGFSGGGAASDW